MSSRGGRVAQGCERVNGVLEQIGAVRSDTSTRTRLMEVALVGTVATKRPLAFTAAGLR